MAFTFYVDNYGFSNLIGHIGKLLSFFFVYKALVETGIRHPYHLIFLELQKQKKELEDANKTKDKFISIMAHDLKNPIGAVINFADILKEDTGELNREDRTSYLSYIHSGAKAMLKLVENLLLWSRAQTGRLAFTPRPLKLKPVIDANLTLVQNQALVKNIRLVSDVDQALVLETEEHMMDTIIRNLVSNAIKFSREGGTVTVQADKQDGHVRLAVIDNGIGMSEERRQKLFDPAAQTGSLGTRQETGSGLGLLICREFVRIHQGRIWVESEPNRGTTVFLEF